MPPPELSPAPAAPTSCNCSFLRCGIEKLTSGSVKSAPAAVLAHDPAAFCDSGPSIFRFFAAGSSAAVAAAPFVGGGAWRSWRMYDEIDENSGWCCGDSPACFSLVFRCANSAVAGWAYAGIMAYRWHCKLSSSAPAGLRMPVRPRAGSLVRVPEQVRF